MKSSKSSASSSAKRARWFASPNKGGFSITLINHARFARAAVPLAAWHRIASLLWNKPNAYELAVLLASRAEGLRLNQAYRNASYVPEVLAFPLAPREGNIVIVPARARERAREFDLPLSDTLVYLFAHAALHLKGYRHGTRMERKERELLRAVGARLPSFLRERS